MLTASATVILPPVVARLTTCRSRRWASTKWSGERCVPRPAYVPYPVLTFSGMYVADPIASVAKLGLVVATGVAMIYARQYAFDRGFLKGELFTLMLFALLGMCVMVSASHMLTLYIGLELLSLALYALIALSRESVPATEAAMKYFVLGALASGLLLYGVSMVYGGTQSLHIVAVAQSIASGNANVTLVSLGLVFIVADLAGMKKLAQGIRTMTYNEAERFVMSAIDRSGAPVQAGRTDNLRSEDATAGLDIRFRSANGTSAWDAPTPTGFDDVIYMLQDKNIDLKRVVESITKSVGQVAAGSTTWLGADRGRAPAHRAQVLRGVTLNFVGTFDGTFQIKQSETQYQCGLQSDM